MRGDSPLRPDAGLPAGRMSESALPPPLCPGLWAFLVSCGQVGHGDARSSTSTALARGMKQTPVSSASTMSPGATRNPQISTSALMATVSIRHLPGRGVISLDQMGHGCVAQNN